MNNPNIFNVVELETDNSNVKYEDDKIECKNFKIDQVIRLREK